MRENPLNLFVRAAKECGDIARLRVGPIHLHVLSHPDYAHHVLVKEARNYRKGTRGYDTMRLLLGNGLVTSEGDFWKRQRRIAQPAFHRRAIAGFVRTMGTASLDLARQWEQMIGDRVDIGDAMTDLTLRIAGETLFSVDVSGDSSVLGDSLTTVLSGFNRLATSVLPNPSRWPTPANRRFNRALTAMEGVVYRIISDRRQGVNEPEAPDLLSMFMGARDEETGESMSDEQLRDEVFTMLMAGHETTANTLTFTLMLLAQHPEVARRVEDELDSVMDEGVPTMEQLGQLQYTKQVIQESLRLYPPIWILGRKAVEDDVIGGYKIPAGSFVYFSPYVIHRHPGFWDNPDKFDPERFDPEHLASQKALGRPKMAYLPFSGGTRKCIGDHFAMMEALTVVATLLRRYRLTLPVDFKETLVPSVTMRLGESLNMAIERRSGGT